MRHIIALAAKFVAVAATLAIVLFAEQVTNSWTVLLTVALFTTLVTYLLGDLALLPATGQFPALLGDIALATLTIWVLPFFLPGFRLRFGDALIAGVALSVVEFFFHRYMQAHVLGTRRSAEQK